MHRCTRSIAGFHPEEKEAELFESVSRFVIIHDAISGLPIAYTMFRFDMEDTMSSRQAQVVYWCVERFWLRFQGVTDSFPG